MVGGANRSLSACLAVYNARKMSISMPFLGFLILKQDPHLPPSPEERPSGEVAKQLLKSLKRRVRVIADSAEIYERLAAPK